MRTLCLNPTTGVAGDMLTAALLDAGADGDEFWALLRGLPLPAEEWSVRIEDVVSGGIAAKHFVVDWQEHHHHHHDHGHHHGRHLPEIVKIIEDSALPEPVKINAKRTLELLAEAEAAVHRTTPDKVHFHEVGAVDAIADICGACLALHLLAVDRVVCGIVPLGSGTVTCDHGELPVPAPAVVRLLADVPVCLGTHKGELTTPTGAALLKTLVDAFETPAAGRLTARGYGAGTRKFEAAPNVLQALVLESDGAGTTPPVCVIECNLDDLPGEQLSHLIPVLLEAGALDVIVVPCLMKKGRQGMLVQVLCQPDDRDRLARLLLRETTSFGVRHYVAGRLCLDRRRETVKTEFGDIRVKIGIAPESGEVWQTAPEYEDCAAAARQHGVPLQQVYAAARQAVAPPT